MSTFVKTESIAPKAARVTDDALVVDLVDGRTISVPLQWFPRLFHGTAAERARYELSNVGIHWQDLNEDIPVDALLRGEKSGESPASIQKWLQARASGQQPSIATLPLPPDVERELKQMGIKAD